jgi:branched-chain amino acid transport system ATP-binding protein
MSLVMDISDEIVVLNFGQKIAEGTPGKIQQNQEVINIYLGGEDD